MKHVYLTNVKVNGETLEDGDDNIMVFSNLDAETVKLAYQDTNITFDECYEVPAKDVQFYIYQPCYLSKNEEKVARQKAKMTPA